MSIRFTLFCFVFLRISCQLSTNRSFGQQQKCDNTVWMCFIFSEYVFVRFERIIKIETFIEINVNKWEVWFYAIFLKMHFLSVRLCASAIVLFVRVVYQTSNTIKHFQLSRWFHIKSWYEMALITVRRVLCVYKQSDVRFRWSSDFNLI